MTLGDKTIVITGGQGFLGRHLVMELQKETPKKVVALSSHSGDLRKEGAGKALFKGADIVIHLAANVGGIGYNKDNPATLFYDNLLMGANVIHEAYLSGVNKFVAIGTICSYPKFTPVPFKEKDFWNGYPEETNAPYGLAKKMLLVQSQAYREQYGFNSIFLMPTNLYGPGDNFDPKSSHVIPALIKKFIDATSKKMKEVIVWGSGKPTREFVYAEDAARGIVMATKHYNKPEPVNLGSSFEISIKELAFLIASLTEYKGKITFDTSKPDGQPRRKLDNSKAKEEFGFYSKVGFKQGLKKTINWYTKIYLNEKDNNLNSY
jgi:GDP-L-fucose synthase